MTMMLDGFAFRRINRRSYIGLRFRRLFLDRLFRRRSYIGCWRVRGRSIADRLVVNGFYIARRFGIVRIVNYNRIFIRIVFARRLVSIAVGVVGNVDTVDFDIVHCFIDEPRNGFLERVICKFGGVIRFRRRCNFWFRFVLDFVGNYSRVAAFLGSSFEILPHGNVDFDGLAAIDTVKCLALIVNQSRNRTYISRMVGATRTLTNRNQASQVRPRHGEHRIRNASYRRSVEWGEFRRIGR